MKFQAGRRKVADACVGERSVGVKPGGCIGVDRVSSGIGGGGKFGGGVRVSPAAYGFVTYDVSDVIDGIGSRNAATRCTREPLIRSLPFGDFLDGDLV